MYQYFFSRYELKFFLTEAQRDALLTLMEPHMRPDLYGPASIRNLYYDTDDFRLIRHSLERPPYKEKLRVRSYGRAAADSPVFIELKKKYRSRGYKRRVAMPEWQAMEWLSGGGFRPKQTQIVKELEYFMEFYGSPGPKAFLSYDREAYVSRGRDGLRITFDTNIRCRRTALSLQCESWGKELLKPGQILMEIKTPGGIPLWLTHFLTENRIYKTSFSKYGAAYLGWLSKDRIRNAKSPVYTYQSARISGKMGTDKPAAAPKKEWNL